LDRGREVVNRRKQKRLSREEEDFPRGSGRSLVNRKNISPGSGRDLSERRNISPRVVEEKWWAGGIFPSGKWKIPNGEEEYIPQGSRRDLVNRRNISSREAEEASRGGYFLQGSGKDLVERRKFPLK
jgi:hypothetical protein